MRILLIEPNYKNKYPPIGLMKISSYHKNRGDYVFFYKGTYDFGCKWDRIYITTLFTFDFNKTVDTINFYKNQVVSNDNIYIGGIMASLMVEKLIKSTGIKNIIQGRLTSSTMLDFKDDINIDKLSLDYDILYDTEYKYPSGDNYFGYITRGCINKCEFCAVPKLEGYLCTENNIVKQITDIKENYGDKRNLLLLDNNILGLSPNDLKKIVSDLNSIGFINKPSYKKPLEIDLLVNSYYRGSNNGNISKKVLNDISNYPIKMLNKRIKSYYKDKINELLKKISTDYDDIIDCVLDNFEFFREIEEKYSYKKYMQRYVDFNQGLDGRQLTEEKMKILSALPIRPFRIAFDNIKFTEIYTKAIRIASKYSNTDFSNYLLYNFDDKPEDLYKRIKINIELDEELNRHIYSFPMCYEPITNTSREHVGQYWNKHYLRSIKAILNVSNGIFSGNYNFFEKAFGRDVEDFYRIISMPKDLITYRTFYENNGVTKRWTDLYLSLDEDSKNELLNLVSIFKYDTENPKLKEIIKYYRISYPKDDLT